MSEKKILKNEVKETLELVDLQRLEKQAEFRKLRGKFRWEGDLEKMRTDSQELQAW
jgi:hypothetical protein